MKLEQAHKKIMEAIGKNVFEADGKAPLEEINQLLKTRWKSEGFSTISGFMIEKLDRLPTQNEKITEGNYTLKAIKVKEPKILRIRIERKQNRKK